MNPMIHFSKKTSTLVITLLLASFAMRPAPSAFGVVPAPDGGYPNFTTAEGDRALHNLAIGSGNTALGWSSLFSDGTGSFNTGVGAGALALNNADSNTATGAVALLSNTTGVQNTATGAFALLANTVDNGNTAVGHNELQSSTGNFNTALGIGAGANVTTAGQVICIGSIGGANVSNTCFINNIRGITTQNNDAMPVLVDSAGQLGTASSSKRYKTDIKPMDKASESILALKPVSFRYKVHKDMTPQFGLIAEDVAAINPNLVIYDTDGKPYTVRYDAVNAMLLNEFLKEHRKVQELEATIAKQQKDFQATATYQQKQIETLAAGLQKVSAQLALSKTAPQTVLNEQ